jgi:pyroglutamyl-peptidase
MLFQLAHLCQRVEWGGLPVFLHFGVNSRGTEFQLECIGYNEATFRVSDEREWQPSQATVSTNADSPSQLHCKLPLQSIADSMNVLGFAVKLSDDPGRFLCNYIYYSTLHLTQSNGISLFIHVPPDEVVASLQPHREPIATYTAFAEELVNAIRALLST